MKKFKRIMEAAKEALNKSDIDGITFEHQKLVFAQIFEILLKDIMPEDLTTTDKLTEE